MWARVAWVEPTPSGNEMEEELTIPLSWVQRKKKKIMWPRSHERKKIKNMEEPQDDWQKFTLLKVKTTSSWYNLHLSCVH